MLSSVLQRSAARHSVANVSPQLCRVGGASKNLSTHAATATAAATSTNQSTFSPDSALEKETHSDRYGRSSILRSEFVYGRGFQGPGGIQSTEKYAKMLGLRSGMKAVDAGCGPGGATFHLAQAYGVHAVGIDLYPEMVKLCQERSEQGEISSEQGSAQFKQGSFEDVALAEKSSLDLVWSRDALIYLPDNAASFATWFSWLKPGGQVFITDYGISKDPTPQYLNYVNSTGQFPQTLPGMAAYLSQAGFKDVKADDISPEFLELYEVDLDTFVSKKGEFVEAHGEEHFETLHQRWLMKIESIRSGSMVWNMVRGTKPE